MFTGAYPLVATGWGLAEAKWPGEVPPPDKLQIINLTNLANAKCKDVWGDLPYFYVSQLCAISMNGKGTCFGDSGGPVTYQGELVGIVSWGSLEGCATTWPDVSASVAYFHDWIQINMVQNS